MSEYPMIAAPPFIRICIGDLKERVAEYRQNRPKEPPKSCAQEENTPDSNILVALMHEALEGRYLAHPRLDEALEHAVGCVYHTDLLSRIEDAGEGSTTHSREAYEEAFDRLFLSEQASPRPTRPGA